jgi:hypothetical protein
MTRPSEHPAPSNRELWWLSFVDTDRCAPAGTGKPGGPGFLGVSIVSANSFMEAVRVARELGCNPGGEVKGYGPYPPGSIPDRYLNRLLTKAEVDDVPDPHASHPTEPEKD